MTSKISRTAGVALVTFSILVGVVAHAETGVDIIDSAIRKRNYRPPEGRTETERQQLVRSELVDLDDTALMRSVVEWAFAQDGNPYVGYKAVQLLEDAGRPSDSSVLREFTREVDDAQEAYKLIHIAGLFREESFIAEAAHLLANTDAAFTPVQERPSERICDIVYRNIVASLAKTDSDFPAPRVPQEGPITNEGRSALLDWLAENWPDCHHLGATKGRRIPPNPANQPLPDRTLPDSAESHGVSESDSHDQSIDVRWVVSGVVLCVFAISYLVLKHLGNSKAQAP